MASPGSPPSGRGNPRPRSLIGAPSLTPAGMAPSNFRPVGNLTAALPPNSAVLRLTVRIAVTSSPRRGFGCSPDSRLPARLDEAEAPGLRVDLLSSGEVGSTVADGTEADPTPLSSRAHRYTYSRNR